MQKLTAFKSFNNRQSISSNINYVTWIDCNMIFAFEMSEAFDDSDTSRKLISIHSNVANLFYRNNEFAE